MDLESIFQGGFSTLKWRSLGEHLKGRKFSAGKGITIEDSPASGVLISAKQAREVRQSQPPPFSVISLRQVPDSDPIEYVAELQEGWVIVRDTQTGADAVLFYPVSIGASQMSARPRPELTLSDGDFVMVNYSTDEEGQITGTATIQAGTEEESDHHNPASGAGSGSAGEYNVKIFKFELDEGAPKVTYYQQSDIEHSTLWTGRNVGGARYIHKEWDGSAARYDFRTLKQFEPVGRTYAKVLVDEVGDEIDDVNDSLKFSALAERVSNPQLSISDDGAGIATFEGNGFDGSITWTDCDGDDTEVLTVVDGFVTATASFTAGCLPSGAYGDILYHNGTSWVVLANPGNVPPGFDNWTLQHDGTSPAWVSML